MFRCALMIRYPSTTAAEPSYPLQESHREKPAQRCRQSRAEAGPRAVGATHQHPHHRIGRREQDEAAQQLDGGLDALVGRPLPDLLHDLKRNDVDQRAEDGEAATPRGPSARTRRPGTPHRAGVRSPARVGRRSRRATRDRARRSRSPRTAAPAMQGRRPGKPPDALRRGPGRPAAGSPDTSSPGPRTTKSAIQESCVACTHEENEGLTCSSCAARSSVNARTVARSSRR